MAQKFSMRAVAMCGVLTFILSATLAIVGPPLLVAGNFATVTSTPIYYCRGHHGVSTVAQASILQMSPEIVCKDGSIEADVGSATFDIAVKRPYLLAGYVVAYAPFVAASVIMLFAIGLIFMATFGMLRARRSAHAIP